MVRPENAATDVRRRPRRRIRRLGVITIAVVVLLGIVLGAQQWMTRAQGAPEAIEFSEAKLEAPMADARIIGLGEATHGNAEFQRLRLDLVRKVDDVGVILLEEDFGRVARINRYVNGGPGDATAMAQQFGFVLNHTAEMADLLRGLREINGQRSADDRIRLVGMDVQRVDASKDLALSWLAGHDPERAAALERRLAGWDDETDPNVATATDAVGDLIAALETHPVGGGGQLARDAAEALRQNLALAKASSRLEERATIMTDNVTRAVDRLPASGRALVFAHNGHLDKVGAAFGGTNLGSRLSERYEERYRVIGTEFVDSTFVSGDRRERWTVTMTNRTPLRGMFAGTREGYLAFPDVSPQNRDLLGRSVGMASAGESFRQWQAWVPFVNSVSMVPARSYDALILVERATAVTPL